MRGFMSSSKDYAADTEDKKKKPRFSKGRKLVKPPKDIVGKVAPMPKIKPIKVASIKTPTSPRSRKKPGSFAY